MQLKVIKPNSFKYPRGDKMSKFQEDFVPNKLKPDVPINDTAAHSAQGE